MSEETVEAKLREELTAEIWDEAIPVIPVESELETNLETNLETEKKEEAKIEEDPWKDVSPAVKETLDKINSQLGGLATIGERLKQAERRVGSIQSEMSATKKVAAEAAEKLDNAPTKEQVAEAEKTEKEWETLKADFPEWANAIESKLSAQSTELAKNMPNVKKVEEKLETDLSGLTTQVAEMSTMIEKNAISFVFPDWKETIKCNLYQTWIAGQPAEMQQLTRSTKAKDAVKVLQAWESHKTAKSPGEAGAARQSRLQKAEAIPNSQKAARSSSVSDMTDEEYRNSISKKIWDD